MKKLIVLAVAILTTNTFFGQTVFDKFDGQDDITAVIVNKKMRHSLLHCQVLMWDFLHQKSCSYGATEGNFVVFFYQFGILMRRSGQIARYTTYSV